MLNKKQLNRYTTILFLVVGILCGVIFTQIENFTFLDKVSNYWYSDRQVAWTMKAETESSYQEAKDALGKNMTLSKELNEYTRGIYFKKSSIKIPLLEGRFFQKGDLKQKNQYAVVGRNYIPNLKEQNGKNYLSYGNIDFEVIGIIGLEQPSVLDGLLFFNLENVEPMMRDNGGVWIMDGHDLKVTVAELKSQLSKNENVQIFQRQNFGTSRIYDLRILKVILVAVCVSISIGIGGIILFYGNSLQHFLVICFLSGFSRRYTLGQLYRRFFCGLIVPFAIGALSVVFVLHRPWINPLLSIVFIAMFCIVSCLLAATVYLWGFYGSVDKKLKGVS